MPITRARSLDPLASELKFNGKYTYPEVDRDENCYDVFHDASCSYDLHENLQDDAHNQRSCVHKVHDPYRALEDSK